MVMASRLAGRDSLWLAMPELSPLALGLALDLAHER